MNGQHSLIGKGDWKSRWGETMLPDICFVCCGETFGLFPIGTGLSRHCHDEIRSGQDG